MSDVTVFVTRYTKACNGVSNALVTLPPTRPVPTRPDPSFINYPRRDFSSCRPVRNAGGSSDAMMSEIEVSNS